MDYEYIKRMFLNNKQEYTVGWLEGFQYIHVCETTYKFDRNGKFIEVYHNG